MKKFLLAFALLSIAFSGFSREKKPKLEKGLYAEIETTRGKILLKLEFEKAPLTVSNFVGLAEGKIPNSAKAEGKPYSTGIPFYDGLLFHRVISKGNGDQQDFMIQGGDPQGTGQGGPGYSFKDEIVPEFQFTGPGVMAMANSGSQYKRQPVFHHHRCLSMAQQSLQHLRPPDHRSGCSKLDEAGR
jgi:peptidyl-prolyl cis-trans isomerase A (cyclophilin A)